MATVPPMSNEMMKESVFFFPEIPESKNKPNGE